MAGAGELRRRSGVRSEEERTDDSTARLLERIRQGDADAFEQVAREQAPRLFRLALKLCGRREDAEDLVQETLVRALPALRRFEGRARLSTYLIRALTNIWKNRLRSRKRSRLVDWFRGKREDDDAQDSLEATAIDPVPSAEQRIEAEQRGAVVRDAIERLEPNRRLALLLREVNEMSYEEIAETTGVAVGTVRSRLARARDDLRRLLEDRL
ncbi:MAG: sigma-70 family RNA polymerase sigma factor [Acidobacteria bacterium]|nr:sigma-70 family RNA polymerase sigma factor [Acidobacteriota bacterium]NIM61395.1 sigma-70 family RNA polymerase sigma factor [Acidobacteriota bacterium]NIO58079.1 sigma-70 family RNA polymerase sigma factor [Acidobacteriota bacterium]NIQ29088.1 sigma-70 family RNA polymerase sigma factor [Acidobacteriota bacterium]NIQ83632.1 sigma-70 family RNA polymerase sigma factor [Acidobacteriota bacterium]